MSVEKHIRNAGLLSGLPSHREYIPSANAAKRFPFLTSETLAFQQEYLEFASDFFEAEAQGVKDDFYEFVPVLIRLSDIVPSQGTTDNLTEDWKKVGFQNPNIGWVGLGAKINVGKDVYIVTNPSNRSTAVTTAIVRRCNAVRKGLDYYGNVTTEPFVWEKGAELATTNYQSEQMVLPNGYNHCVMQLNENSADLTDGARIVLGNTVYNVRGVVQFMREFTNDEDSSHIVYFDLHRDQPGEYDDMKRKIADGLAFSWDIIVTGSPTMAIGMEQTLSMRSIRNGVYENGAHTVSYLFGTSDQSIAKIDAQGKITALASGSCEITVSLAQNPDISTVLKLTVAEENPGVLSVSGNDLTYIKQGQKAIFNANMPVTFKFSGVDNKRAGILTAATSATVTCYYPQDTPITMTAEADGQVVTKIIQLTSF